MAVRGRTFRGLGFGLIIALAVPLASASSPVGVSPGAPDRVAQVEGRCPTFTWGAVPGAVGYELVVYRLPDESRSRSDGALELSASDEVLFAALPAGANAWQPELADGLDPGGSYVWFVRAVLREEAGEVVDAGDWSAGRFFSIPAKPSQMEVDEALAVLRRYSEAAGAHVAETDEEESEAQSNGAARRPAGRQSVDAPGSVKSVPTATAAIRGTIPDTTGETYGVVGISSSPDGAGVAASNLNGGPDLVLDGSADGFTDALLSQNRLDRPSADPRGFNFVNSGGGGMTLRVEGVDVVTTLTDQDTLAAVAPTCAQWQVPKWDGGGWICAEDRNLLASLGCTTDQIAKHDGTTWVCAPDNDTTYSAGPGLIVDGGEIRIDPAAFSTSIATLDSVGFVGTETSIAIGADGLGLISYYDSGNSSLKVAHCNNQVCSSASTATIDSAGTVGNFSSIAIGTDGLGLISYYDLTNSNLKVAHCTNAACSSASTFTVDSSGSVGAHTSIVIGDDGLGLISYYDGSNHGLKVAHCNNVACSNASSAILDSADVVGLYGSIAIGADGLGLISYYDATNADLKVAHCNDTVCSSATTNTIRSFSDVGQYTSIAIGADGLGFISYYNENRADLGLAHCANIPCSSATTWDVDGDDGADVGSHNSVAIGADGLGLISYFDATTWDLKVAHCANTACSSATTAFIDIVGDVGFYTSVAIGADGLGLIAYHDVNNGDLRVAHLGIGVP